LINCQIVFKLTIIKQATEYTRHLSNQDFAKKINQKNVTYYSTVTIPHKSNINNGTKILNKILRTDLIS